MIRAIIFDYGGVLMRTVNPVPRRELEQRLGLSSGEVDKVVLRPKANARQRECR